MAHCKVVLCSKEVAKWGDYCHEHRHLDPKEKAKVGKLDEVDCSYNRNIICPFCGYEMEDDEHDVEQDSYQEWECGKCDEVFYVTMQVDITYSTSKKNNGTWDDEEDSHDKS